MIIKLCILWLLLVITQFIFHGNEISANGIEIKPLEISLDDAQALALKNNLDIEIVSYTAKQKTWQMASSWNTLLPDLTLEAELKRIHYTESKEVLNPVGPVIGSSYGVIPETKDVPNWNLKASFNMSLMVSAAKVFGIYQTVLYWQEGKIGLKMAEKELVKQTKVAFFTLLWLNQKLMIFESELEAAKKRSDIARVRYERGTGTLFTNQITTVAYRNMMIDFFKMKQDYDNLLFFFKKSLGVKEDIKICLTGDLKSSYKVKELCKEDNPDSLEIERMKLNLQIKRNERNLQISMLTPYILLEYSLDPSFQDDPTIYRWFGDSEYNSDYWKQKNGAFTLSVTLPLQSLIPFSMNQMRIISNEYEIKREKLVLEKLKSEIRTRVIILTEDLKKSANLIPIMKDTLEMAQNTYKLAETGYEEGSLGIKEAENASSELLTAQLYLLNEEYNVKIKEIELEEILGRI